MTLRIGSLCSGVGMLDLAVESVLPDAQLAWYAQYEPPNSKGKPDRNQYAAKVMAHRFPGVPNHGDITAIDYAGVAPVGILTAGFPCQDISLAGKRAGLREGTRSGIWSHVARAIEALRPSLVLLENVRSLTSAWADSDLESCPWCLGDAGDEHSLRALGAVLGDLADLGFDASWEVVRASDVGAPHKRERVFVLAWPAAEDPDIAARGERRLAAPGQAAGGRAWADARGRGGAPAPDAERHGRAGRREAASAEADALRPGPRTEAAGPRSSALADAPGDGWREGGAEPARLVGRPDAAERGRAVAADTQGARREGPRPQPEGGRPEPGDQPASHAHGDAVREQPVAEFRCGGTPVAELARPDTVADPDSGGRGPVQYDDAEGQPDLARRAAPDSDGAALGAQRDREPDGPETDDGRHRLDASGRFLGWGPYELAIRRWERVLARPAPSPVDDRGRLNPLFVEWMMGLPAGWVTGVPGIPRNAQLKALGNGVVPRQGALALRSLLGDCRPAMAELTATEGVAA